MNGGVTYRDMDERKAAVKTLNRLEIWLTKEAMVFDHLTPDAISVIRTVLRGQIDTPELETRP